MSGSGEVTDGFTGVLGGVARLAAWLVRDFLSKRSCFAPAWMLLSRREADLEWVSEGLTQCLALLAA